MPNHEKSRISKSKTIDKFHEIEIQKIFDALLSLQNLRVQTGTFFGTANLTALGIAFSTQKAGIVFFAAILFWVFIVQDIITRGTLLRYYYRSFVLQERFASGEDNTFLGVFLSLKTEEKIRRIHKMSQVKERLNALKRLPVRDLGTNGFWVPLIMSLVEIGLGICLWLIFNWSLF